MPRRAPIPDVRFARLSKSGRGFALTMPRALLTQLGWRYGTTLELWISGSVLCVGKATSTRDQIQAVEGSADAVLPGPEED